MRALQRLKNSIRHQGLRTTIFKFYVLILDFFFDIKYRTDTCKLSKLDDLTIESDNKERGAIYQATRIIPLKKIFNSIKRMIPPNGVFVDFGCGKGRVLLIASQFGFKKVRGVEFAHELCEIAKNNCAVYKRKTKVRTEFQIIESDVVDYVIKNDENVFFMFNPFDEAVLSEVLNNIATSLTIQPRRILIIYYNPKYGNYIEQQDNFVKSGELLFWGYNFAVYSISESLSLSTRSKRHGTRGDELSR